MKSENLILLLAPVVIDRRLKVIPHGFVAICGERTLGTGAQSRLSIPKNAKVIPLKNRILMPGLVNAHCHLDYTLMKGGVPAAGGFTEWVSRIVEKKRSWSDADYKTSIQRGMLQCLESGTTTIANITCVPHLISSLNLKDTPGIWWFVELLDLGRAGQSTAGEWKKNLAARSAHRRLSLSPHAPYSVTPGLFQKAVTFCDNHRLPWTTHVAESRDEWDMFHNASGPLFDWVRNIGSDMSNCGNKTPFQRLLESCRAARPPRRPVTPNTPSPAHRKMHSRAPAILAHMNCLSDQDLRSLKTHRGHFSIAHCPRSHAFFHHPPFRLNDLRALGVNLCLGTDSLASNRNMNMFSEMRKLAQKFPKIPAKSVVQMATENGAIALGERENWPHWADWIAIPHRGADPFKSIIAFADSPSFVMVAGRIVKK